MTTVYLPLFQRQCVVAFPNTVFSSQHITTYWVRGAHSSDLYIVITALFTLNGSFLFAHDSCGTNIRFYWLKWAALKGKLIFLGLFKFFSLSHRLRRSGCREVHAPVADTTCPHGATTRPADGAEGGPPHIMNPNLAAWKPSSPIRNPASHLEEGNWPRL